MTTLCLAKSVEVLSPGKFATHHEKHRKVLPVHKKPVDETTKSNRRPTGPPKKLEAATSKEDLLVDEISVETKETRSEVYGEPKKESEN